MNTLEDIKMPSALLEVDKSNREKYKNADLRGIAVSILEKIITEPKLYRLALPAPYRFATDGFKQELIQRNSQIKSKKRLFVHYDLEGTSYSIRLSTKEIRGKLVAQQIYLSCPNNETIYYRFLNQRGYGILSENGILSRDVNPDDALNIMLIKAYGLSQQPH